MPRDGGGRRAKRHLLSDGIHAAVRTGARGGQETRWFMSDVEKVSAIGATLAFPELNALGDFDNAIATMVFTDGRLGVVDVTRNGYYGYDITTEVVGTAGTVRVGYIQETPLLIMTKNNVSHDTVPYFPERFERAYIQQL